MSTTECFPTKPTGYKTILLDLLYQMVYNDGMIECRYCKWCFKPIKSNEDFIVTNEWDFGHIKCYRQLDELLKEVEQKESKDIRE